MSFVLNKKLYSAIDILLCISLQKTVQPVSSKIISEGTGMGLRYVEQILQPLVKQNILKSIRGANGGYVISKDRRNINLKDIYSALFGEKDQKAENDQNLLISDINSEIEGKVKDILKNMSLHDIYNKALANKNLSKAKTKSDFMI